MDNTKIGELILALRKEKGMTQKQLAHLIHISDKTISKWERGQGCPDISILPTLSHILGVSSDLLLTGTLTPNALIGGNMKQTLFYVCPTCHNLITSSNLIDMSCCGKKLEALIPKKADDHHTLSFETLEDEWFISSSHEMTKEHYIGFTAYVSGEMVEIIKHYPEWHLARNMSKKRHGKFYFYCSMHGLFYKVI